ncbi:MAG: zinc ABC transporter substrate-binding protein [Xenococcaceae cyanobacterium]
MSRCYLITPGTEIHDYQATPEDAQTINQANILVKNGLGIEEFLESLIANVGNTELQQIDASSGIEVIEEEESQHHREDEHHHEAGNPHIWLDPVLAQQQIANIRDGLIVADPNNADIYKTNAEAYIQQLQQLDNEFSQRLAPMKGCKFITFHNAFPYLARRYELQQEAIVEIPEDNITPKDIQRVQQAAEQFQVKALITEPGIPDKRIQQISDDLNLPKIAIDPIEAGETNPQYYFQAMRNNLAALERACK